jgi:hypothetical protein
VGKGFWDRGRKMKKKVEKEEEEEEKKEEKSAYCQEGGKERIMP